jgi:hypothetical protein
MATRGPRPNKTMRTAVDLAVAAVQGNPSVMDLPMAGFDPSPGALDLAENEVRERCSRCGRPAEDRCPECGCSLCKRCLDGNVR